jgi:metal-responsive CopG/Arc/MetJ family transcriptional regulator
MLRHARALGVTVAPPDNLLAKVDKAAARQHLSRSAMHEAA